MEVTVILLGLTCLALAVMFVRVALKYDAFVTEVNKDLAGSIIIDESDPEDTNIYIEFEDAQSIKNMRHVAVFQVIRHK